MPALHKRIVIYPKDIEILTGRSERGARKLLQTIRTKLGKQNHEFVTVKEFSKFTGIPENYIHEHLKL